MQEAWHPGPGPFCDPLPSWPYWLSPQHSTFPVARAAHVWFAPAATEIALAIPLTSTGVALSFVDPLPSCPAAFKPQHSIVPALNRAHVCSPPAAIIFAPEAGLIVHVNDVLLDGPLASVAVMVVVELPAVVGLPLIWPVLGLINSPAGRPVAL
jgi:hypothetical protein